MGQSTGFAAGPWKVRHAASGGHIPLPGFSGFQRLERMGIRPVSGGLSVLLFCSEKINNTKRANKHCCRGPQGPRHQQENSSLIVG
jgi:hypothetical protein